MTQRELKQRIMDDPDLTRDEKAKLLNALRAPYVKMSDEELLQLVRDFTRENGREPTQRDVIYDRELKARFGPWNRMLERAGTRPVGEQGARKTAPVTRNTAGRCESSRKALPLSKYWLNYPADRRERRTLDRTAGSNRSQVRQAQDE